MHTTEQDRTAELHRAVGLYTRLVYGIALHELTGGSRADADDVFQEVFLLYFRKLPSLDFGCEEERRAWLARVTVNLCRRTNLSPWNTRVDKLDPGDLTQSAAELFPDGQENAVFEAVRELPEKYRLPVYLHYFENMPVSEIAELLKVRENTVLKETKEKSGG